MTSGDMPTAMIVSNSRPCRHRLSLSLVLLPVLFLLLSHVCVVFVSFLFQFCFMSVLFLFHVSFFL